MQISKVDCTFIQIIESGGEQLSSEKTKLPPPRPPGLLLVSSLGVFGVPFGFALSIWHVDPPIFSPLKATALSRSSGSARST